MKVLISESAGQAKIKFEGRVLILGFGSVGRGMLPCLLRHFDIPGANITVLEKHDSREYFDSLYHGTGIKYMTKEIRRTNMKSVLAEHVQEGDLILNFSLNIDGIEIVTWCLENNILYIDTSIERWPEQPDEDMSLQSRTLYEEHQDIRRAVAPFKDRATVLVSHGANPGLVSHFTKAALLDMAQAVGEEVQVPQNREEWADLMHILAVNVIHISERDTQVVNDPKKKNEFVNTWSCEGFWAEGRAPAEMGWGTHEPELPHHAFEHQSGPKNAIYFDKPGVSMMAKSWAPRGREFNGFIVQHSEAITISEYFTVMEDDKPTYRPTVHYVYCPTDVALASVFEFKGKELDMQTNSRIAKAEIISGIDELGVLLLGERICWWYGSQLGINKTRELMPENNATTLQVVASIYSAMRWMLANPRRGYCEPEDLPHDEILKHALQYLGPMASTKTRWRPTMNYNKLYSRRVDNGEPWSFANFRVY